MTDEEKILREKLAKYSQALEYIKKIANDDFGKFPFERSLLLTAVDEALK